MLYAIDPSGARVTASKSIQATCPCCKVRVIPKCGEIVTWHFAHESLADCDVWSEGESEWHAGWKRRWPEPCREVVVGPHRADVKTESGLVVELQHSAISVEEITEREAFYGSSMIWLFDAREACESERLHLRFHSTEHGRAWTTFRWKHPRKTIAWSERKVFLDLGAERVLEIRKIHYGETKSVSYGGGIVFDHVNNTFAGWGYTHTYDEFTEAHGAAKVVA